MNIYVVEFQYGTAIPKLFYKLEDALTDLYLEAYKDAIKSHYHPMPSISNELLAERVHLFSTLQLTEEDWDVGWVETSDYLYEHETEVGVSEKYTAYFTGYFWTIYLTEIK